MDSHITSSTFLPQPVNGESSAPLAQPDDDFGISLSAAGTPNTPADDSGTGSTASPVSPVHLHNRQPHDGAGTTDDEQAGMNFGSATDDNVGLLPPPGEMENEKRRAKDCTGAIASKISDDANENDDQVSVLAMSGILPATTAVGGGASETKKNTTGNAVDGDGSGGAAGNGEKKSHEK